MTRLRLPAALWQWLTHDFFKVSAALFSLNLVGTILNMLCRILLGRMLTSEQYGEMETLMQVGVYVGVPLAAIQTSVTSEVARSMGEGRPGRAGDILWQVGRRMGGYVLVAMVLLMAAAPFIRDFFKLNSVWPVIATSSIVMSMFLSSIIFGGLQGSHRFWEGGVAALALPSFRIGLSWALIRQGFGATGALAAHAGASLMMVLAGFGFCLNLLRRRERKPVPMGVLTRLLIPLMLVFWLAALFGGVDMFIVKRVFSKWVAGDYARVSAVVRLSLFFSGALTITLFPWVASEKAGGRETTHLLIRAMAAYLAAGFAAACAFMLIPGFLLGIFYRDVSPDMILWVKVLSWALIPLGMFNILLQYHLARQDFRFLYGLVPAGAGYLGLLLLFRQSIPELIAAMGVGGVVVTGLMLVPAFKSKGPPLQPGG